MPPRPFWRGYLKLSLVTCPVAMTPATSDRAKLRFHTLNEATGNRVVSRYVDAATGQPVAEEDEVKGYARGEGDYVLLEEEELEAVALESTRSIDIHTFVPQGSIDWIWYDRPHYLMPDDRVGEEAFAVIRAAMEDTGTVGISRLVMYRRERAVMLVPRGRGIVLWTLRYGDEVRPSGGLFDGLQNTTADAPALKLVSRLITARQEPWSPDMAQDPVQEELAQIIAAKQKGRKRPAPRRGKAEDDTPRSNVVSILDALKQSLAADRKARK